MPPRGFRTEKLTDGTESASSWSVKPLYRKPTCLQPQAIKHDHGTVHSLHAVQHSDNTDHESTANTNCLLHI